MSDKRYKGLRTMSDSERRKHLAEIHGMDVPADVKGEDWRRFSSRHDREHSLGGSYMQNNRHGHRSSFLSDVW